MEGCCFVGGSACFCGVQGTAPEVGDRTMHGL